MRRQAGPDARYGRGFTLVELMLGMVLGLFLMGGIMSVFLSNQATSTAKQALDRSQEHLRFGAHTITRMVRQAGGVESGSDGSTLVIQVRRRPDTPDCGGPGNAQAGTNTFYIDNGGLLCRDVEGVEHVLFRAVGSLVFEYGRDANDDGLIASGEYFGAADVGGWTESEWSEVRSVRTRLELNEAQNDTSRTLRFVATLRSKALALNTAGGPGVPVEPEPGDEDTGSEGDTSSPAPGDGTPEDDDTDTDTEPPLSDEPGDGPSGPAVRLPVSVSCTGRRDRGFTSTPAGYAGCCSEAAAEGSVCKGNSPCTFTTACYPAQAD
ncbi:MAG: prepilin-type N-terminal cleavage/methylation domain-containing protein [Rhodocyclaceae bacterium]|jgi:type II secretory pathway pseudopilin PulG|nr:prepilin-type N-terminal cleavage/methylation domain-containing protein [Rhodocyclaceae bacterium]